MINATCAITPEQFSQKEYLFLEAGSCSASLFRFSSGVCAVRLRNDRGELVLLPFQGQQIWSARMDGRELTMKSMFEQPAPTQDFLATFGGFFVHCGATAMGVPGPEDNHPLHGELPNAPYRCAKIVLGKDEDGDFIGLTGSYEHTVAFNDHYLAQPLVKLYAGSSIFHVSMNVTNLKHSRMSLMYLAHVNFRPVDLGRLVYSVPCIPSHMRVKADIPAAMQTPPGYRELLQDLEDHPEKHLCLDPQLVYDPEMIFYLDYQAGPDGWAHALQIHPDGSADVVRHRPAQLPHAQQWICRTADQDALGFEPATAEGTGFSSEKKKGNVKTLEPGEQFHCDMKIGVLTPREVDLEEKLALQIVKA